MTFAEFIWTISLKKAWKLFIRFVVDGHIFCLFNFRIMIMINAGEKQLNLIPFWELTCHDCILCVMQAWNRCTVYSLPEYTRKSSKKKKKKKRSDQYAGVYSRDSSSCHIHSWSRINLDIKLIIMIVHMIGGCMKYQIVSFLLHAINLYTVPYLLELICGIIPQYLLRLNFWGMLSMLSIPMSFLGW